jgi:hypothetical protein
MVDIDFSLGQAQEAVSRRTFYCSNTGLMRLSNEKTSSHFSCVSSLRSLTTMACRDFPVVPEPYQGAKALHPCRLSPLQSRQTKAAGLPDFRIPWPRMNQPRNRVYRRVLRGDIGLWSNEGG